MAVVVGFLIESGLSDYENWHITPDLDEFADDWINNPVSWAQLASPGIDALIENYPVSAAPSAKTGQISRSYFGDFYNRVHINPAVLDIGNLLSVQHRDVSVWNAWLVSQALASIDEQDTDGLSESGVLTPSTFAPLQEQNFSLTVDTAGPSTIDALYTFNFPLESPTLGVIGRRVVVFGHAPNWADEVTESYAFKTDVIKSYGGAEQRFGLLDVPRRSLAYSLLTLSQNESNRLDNLLMGWQSRLFAVPVWTDSQNLSADLPAGSSFIGCNTDGYEFAAADLAVLWTAHDQHESVEIESVGVGGLTLASVTLNDWSAGARIMPVRLGWLSPSQDLKRETKHYFSGRVVFDFDDHPGWPVLDSGDDYLGYKVYLEKPNWVDGLSLQQERQLSDLDYGIGKRWRRDQSGLASLINGFNWTLDSRVAIAAFRSWLAARDGRRNPFWIETQGKDMELLSPVGATSTSMVIRNIAYQRYLNARVDRRHMAIRLKSGAVFYRQITGATEDSDTQESIAFDSQLGVLVDPSDIQSIRFLQFSRLESDSIDINWIHLALAKSTAAMRSLPK